MDFFGRSGVQFGVGTGGKGAGALCFEWGFTRTFPGNQDVAVK